MQPILVLDLLFAVVITYVLNRRRPDKVIASGVLCCTGGLVLFLAVALGVPAGHRRAIHPDTAGPPTVGVMALS